MQLERLKCFYDELVGAQEVLDLTTQTDLYYLFEDTWFDSASHQIEDDELIAALSATLDRKSHWRSRNDRTTFFPVGEHSAVIVAEFYSPPKIRTRDKFGRCIDQCLRHATDAFNSTHDLLTGLLNAAAIDKQLLRSLESLPAVVPEEATEQAVITTNSVSLLAIDIDHFKQINDTYGHEYGNIVLYSLARRLVRFFAQDAPDLVTHIARPHGEEFLVLLSDPSAHADLASKLASALCAHVSAETLPSDSDWATTDLHERTASLQFPAASERKLRVSVGIATLAANVPDESVQLAAQLKIKADIALYKAKSLGRDQAIHFNDILEKYGTVLEHHPETGIVTIDIGKHAGVMIGQEFKVYHPSFTGLQSFTYDDGRTLRRLGRYPRVSMGRIATFDVQQDISFCNVHAHPLNNSRFPVGSHLEAIPIGSIAHLIEEQQLPAVVSSSSLVSSKIFQERLHQLVESESMPGVLVFRLLNDQRLANERGIVSVNAVLAKLYDAIRQTFGVEVDVSQTQATEFAALSKESSNWDSLKPLAQAVIDRAVAAAGGGVAFAAGGFSIEPATTRRPGDQS